MILKKLILVFCVLVGASAIAQEGTTSPYSFFGLGTQKFKGTAENRAMAGLSIFSDSIHLNLKNPSSVADLRLVNFTVGASHKRQTQITTSEEQNTTTTSLDYLAIGIPMGKFGASFGIVPYTAVGYKLLTANEDKKTIYSGQGGLNKVFLNLGYTIIEGLNVGADINYNFGNIQNNSISSQEDIQYASGENNKADILGLSLTFGAMYKKMITEKLELTTSITYTPATNFTADINRIIGTYSITATGNAIPVDVRNVSVSSTTFKNSAQITIGAGIGAPKYWGLGAEFTAQKAQNFNLGNLAVSGIAFSNSSEYKVGGYYIPNYNAIGSYLKRVVYRGGFRYEQTGLALNGQNINEFGISFGVGLPVGRLFSNVNLGFEIGKRGTTDFGLVKENFFNTILSFSLNDRWFEKRYYE